MNLEEARRRAERLEETAEKDRIFLNNPAVMQGLGLAPLVVAATSGINALRLAAAAALLLIFTSVIAGLICFWLGQSLAVRGFVYCMVSSVLYIGVYQLMTLLFGVELLQLGLYLPLLVVEPLILKPYEEPPARPPRSARELWDWLTATVPDRVLAAFGYAIVLLLLGCGRELLSAGTVFGQPVTERILLPVASLPSGGFILLGILCAVWRGIASAWRHHVNTEARRGV